MIQHADNQPQVARAKMIVVVFNTSDILYIHGNADSPIATQIALASGNVLEFTFYADRCNSMSMFGMDW